TGGWISDVRVSPDGNRVAFLDHSTYGDDGGTVSVVDRNKQKKVLTPVWASANGLAWSTDASEIWFTASDFGPNCALYATDLDGRRRLITKMLGRLVIEDIHRDGTLLLTESRFRIGMAYRRLPDTAEHDLSWLD